MDIEDLSSSLHFSLEGGQIWLGGQRVTLIHLSTLASLRSELIASLGVPRARDFLFRMGYTSGSRDAVYAREVGSQQNIREFFLVGAQLRALQGTVLMETVRLDANPEAGTYYGEFLLKDSFEADTQISLYGMAAEPVCWILTGFACGYTSTFMGNQVLFKEVECRAVGNRHCRVIGKPAEEWGDTGEEVSVWRPGTFLNHLVADNAQATAPVRKAPQIDRTILESDNMIGTSSGFTAACHMLRKVAATDATVLFQGETGVGKEAFARTLHRMSRRADKPFVAVNCAAIPENLIEAELFGVEKGAFTGAVKSRPGRFERADGGTLFLDEIDKLNLNHQSKLLRVLQEAEIERVGDTRVRKTDVRIVAAANTDLRKEVEKGVFREDLLYRLSVFPIHIPPLRDRRDDIPLLIDHFLRKFTKGHGKNITGITQRAVAALLDYDYRGNIREMMNIIERAVILADEGRPIDLYQLFTFGEQVETAMLGLGNDGRLHHPPPSGTEAGKSSASLRQLVGEILEERAPMAEIEQILIGETMKRAKGNVSSAARMLGLTRPQLAYRLKKSAEPN